MKGGYGGFKRLTVKSATGAARAELVQAAPGPRGAHGAFATIARAARFAWGKVAGSSSVNLRLTDAELGRFFGNVSASGKAVTDDAVMGISAAWSCMRGLSETIGSIPRAVFRKDKNGNAEPADDHPLAEVLVHSPNGDMTAVEFMETEVLNLCQRGNAYSFRENRGDGTPSSLTPIESRDVKPIRKDGGNTRLALAERDIFYRVADRGKSEDFPREKIWHVKGFGKNALEGLSPIGAAREAMGLALATEDFGARFFSQGGMPSGTLTTEKWLDPEQRAIARENLNQMLGGLGNAHKFALFEGGMKPEAWGEMSLEDMQFLLLRKFSVAEICRFYRYPLHMVADLERATNNNIEHMSLEFVMFTLMPYFTRFEASASKWLLKPGDRGKYFLRFNYEGLLRADSAGRSEFHSKMLQNGVVSRNEVRAKENMNRVDGLDAYTVQSNMVPVDQLAAIVAAQIAKGSMPVAAPTAEAPKSVHVNLPAERGPAFSLVLPEGFAKDAKWADHPVIKGLAERSRLIEAQTRAALAEFEAENKRREAALAALEAENRHRAAALEAENKRRADALVEEIRRSQYRVPVFDQAGEPIGTRPATEAERKTLH